VAQDECSQECTRPGLENQNCLSNGQATEHEALRVWTQLSLHLTLPYNSPLSHQQVPLRSGERGLEEVEEALLYFSPSLAIHLCHVLLQGEEVGAHRNDAVGWIYG
jgi:hypothetical protein